MSKYSVKQLGQDQAAAIEAVLGRTARDPEFRAFAIQDPRAAIREETGVEVPENFKILFVDAQGYDMITPLPAPVSVQDELSEVDLEHVAGGCALCDLGDIGLGDL